MVMTIGSSGTRIHSTQAPSENAPKMASAITPKPKLPVAVADGIFRNQPREVTWLRTESLMAVWAVSRLPWADRSLVAPGGWPLNRLVSRTISCGAAATFGSTRVTRKSLSFSLSTLRPPRTARSMIVAAVSRVSTWPSISRPASATGIRGGEKATGIGRSGSLGTICAS